jgi:hypothetical protein
LASLRAEVDPTFTGPSPEALDDARRRWRDEADLDLPEILVGNIFDLQRALGPASLEAVLREATADELADAHRDAQFLLTPLRLIAAEVVDSGEGPLEGLLNLVIGLGHHLHTAALVLRHGGYGGRLDQTVHHLGVLWATPAVHDAFWATVAFIRTNGGFTGKDRRATTGPPSPEALSQIGEYWDNPELRSAFHAAWLGMKDAWADRAGPLVDLLIQAFGADPTAAPDQAVDVE